MDNQFPWWVSSTGQGIAQRIVSLVMLIVPVLSIFGLNVSFGQADVQLLVNSLFIVAFAVWHLWASARANFFKQNKMGKYAAHQ